MFHGWVRISTVAFVGLLASTSCMAGHWSSTLTGSGTVVTIVDGVETDTSWNTGRTLLDSAGASCSPGHSKSVSTSGTLTQTWTWVPDDPSDAAPDHVWIYQTASADGGSDTAGATVSADDGLGDAAITIGYSKLSACTKDHLTRVTVTSGTFSKSISVSAASANIEPNGNCIHSGDC